MKLGIPVLGCWVALRGTRNEMLLRPIALCGPLFRSGPCLFRSSSYSRLVKCRFMFRLEEVRGSSAGKPLKFSHPQRLPALRG